ncbi:hypothetical protein ACHAPA_003218 [Fusarium lateritium]
MLCQSGPLAGTKFKVSCNPNAFSSLSRNEENNSSLEDRFLSILRATGILDDELVANLNIDNDWKEVIKGQVSRRLSKDIVDSMETCAMLLKHAADDAVVKDIVVEQLRVLASEEFITARTDYTILYNGSGKRPTRNVNNN